jgi:O-antigen ligase
MRAYILGGYITIFSTVFNYITGQGISTYQADRFAGAGTNANDLALILALGLPIAWYLAVTTSKDTRKTFLTLICYAYVPAALFSISLTASRMALFATVPAFVYILATAKRLKPLYGVLILAALIGSLPFIPQASIDRLGTTGTSLSTGDLGGRGRLWHASMGVFLEHPLLGIGSGVLSTANAIGAAAHNTFLSVMAELGLIGLIFFAGMLAIVTVQALKQAKSTSQLWITVLSIWAVGVFTLTWEYRKTTWLLFSFVVISSSLYRRGHSGMEGPSASDFALLRAGFSGSRETH